MSTRTRTRQDDEDDGNDDQGNTMGTTDDPGDEETTKTRDRETQDHLPLAGRIARTTGQRDNGNETTGETNEKPGEGNGTTGGRKTE